jgi:hypothetical protein
MADHVAPGSQCSASITLAERREQLTEKEFVAEYRNRIIEFGAFFAEGIDDPREDQGFSAPNLAKFLDEHQGMLQALTEFRMSGENLADIVYDIGGAEMYTFKDLPLLEDIRSLRTHMILDHGTEPIKNIENAQIAVYVVRRWMKERGIAEVDRFDSFWDDREPGPPKYFITVDHALSGIINARQIAILQDYNHMLIGDDKYFDYDPGEMIYYSMAVMNWFLNDGPRSC